MDTSVYGEYILTVHAIINQDFDTGIAFIVSVYDENGVMKTSFSKTLEGSEIDTEKECLVGILFVCCTLHKGFLKRHGDKKTVAFLYLMILGIPYWNLSELL